MTAPAPAAEARPPHVVVINCDDSWDFVSLVRSRALDLYPRSQRVDFLDMAQRSGPSEADAPIWGNWPKVPDSFDAAFATVVDIVQDLAAHEELAIVLVFDTVASVNHNGKLLDFVGKLALWSEKDLLSRVWRVGVFRSRPPSPLSECAGLVLTVDAGNPGAGAVAVPIHAAPPRRLLQNLMFLGSDEDHGFATANTALFDGLRMVVDVVRDHAGGWNRLRSGAVETATSCVWLKSPALSRHEAVEATASYVIRCRIVDACAIYEMRQGALATDDTPSLEALVDQHVARVEDILRERPLVPPTLDHAWGNDFDGKRFIQTRAFLERLEEVPKRIRLEIDAYSDGILDEFRREQRLYEESMEQEERRLVDAIAGLPTNKLGTRGKAVHQVELLIEKIREKKRDTYRAAGAARTELSQIWELTSISSESGNEAYRPVYRRRELPEDGKTIISFEKTLTAARALPEFFSFTIAFSVMFLILSAVVFSYHGALGKFVTTIVRWEGALVAHAVYFWCAAVWVIAATGVAAARAWRRLWRRRDVTRQYAIHLLGEIARLSQNCSRYANRCRSVGWLTLIERRLLKLAADIKRAEQFQDVFERLILVGERASAGDADLAWSAPEQLIDEMERRNRTEWMTLLLTRIPRPPADGRLTLDFGPEWEVTVASSHCLRSIRVSATALRITADAKVPVASHGVGAGWPATVVPLVNRHVGP